MVKINIGCGPNGRLAGFDNLDNSLSVLVSRSSLLKRLLLKLGLISEGQYQADWSSVTWCDASRRLPYRDRSVDKVYTSHFLEHIPLKRGLRVLRECYRVLKPGGVIRIVVPDLLYYARKYVEDTDGLLRASPLPRDRQAHDYFLDLVCGAYLTRSRYGAKHCYMYDLPTIVSILENAGFQRIIPCGYRKGIDAELASHDTRPEGSLHVESIR